VTARLTNSAGDTPTRLAEELAIIWPLLGRHIAFHRRLVDLTASAKAALLLSQTIYWTRHGKGIVQTGGWFYKTTQQWERETGLSAKEQVTARQVLRGLAILNEQRMGMPAKLHFRLAVEQLGEWLSRRIGRACARVDWNDAAALAALLGPTLAYHRTLAVVAGGVNAGLLLSRALHLTRLQSKRQSDGWLSRSIPQWTEELGLTRREQEGARRALAGAGLWEEETVGTPAHLVARIRIDALLALLRESVGDEPGRPHRALDARLPDCGNPATSHAPKGETRLRESHIHVSPKAPNLFHQKRHACFTKTAIPYIEVITRSSLQPLHAHPDSIEIGASQGGGELILPERLLPEERATALALVQRFPDLAQALLDELSARLRANAVHTSPIAYLRGMVTRAEAGTFVPELGLRVAAARRAREEQTRLREQRDTEAQRRAVERTSPEYQAKVAARREEIRRMLDAMWAGRSERKTR
jgi:hypothetical protein